ncbi:macro domain-containing protein [Leminorella grimontii]|uniref:Macro domain-containing protein n=1 Tax=Leminorella grimontii TaxID=82981 RepID=A0AAV5MY82_9GAMM|nr:O-acetyl-ADP-ribose deacetylase [Leminorella grimontii]KFC96017.1 putative ADP-ribose binding protein [Leminorella grimontii ATCC 33999 = DSM 5078]GKX54801.1 macro domain-containing protein [Leminorella grimontii]VFS58431.1 O-acetyl-ADP-ribose deacetylase [Leminorella grimontii]
MKEKIHVLKGDITLIAADAIVNAANTSLLGGGGVDGAIHRAGGKEILDECRKIIARQGKCDVGEAVVTSAGKLPVKYVIHTVGPFWSGGQRNEAELLQKAYRSCFQRVKALGIASVSFPNISTGIYRFPKEAAAEIALAAIFDALADNPAIEKVNVVCFEQENADIYRALLAGINDA